jgi:hypothetical protein
MNNSSTCAAEVQEWLIWANRVDFVMSADVRYVANFETTNWPLSTLCRVPLAVEGNLLGSRPGTRRGPRALALRALPHRVAAQRPGPGEEHGRAAADCEGAHWSCNGASCVAGQTSELPSARGHGRSGKLREVARNSGLSRSRQTAYT